MRRVLDITPECPCGWRSQTLKHIAIYCPLRQEHRKQLIDRAGTTSWIRMTRTRHSLDALVKWMISQSILDQFSLAREEEARDGRGA
jgi:hypothetical protein